MLKNSVMEQYLSSIHQEINITYNISVQSISHKCEIKKRKNKKSEYSISIVNGPGMEKDLSVIKLHTTNFVNYFLA